MKADGRSEMVTDGATFRRWMTKVSGLSAPQARRFLAALLEVVGEAMAEGESVEIDDFGTFWVSSPRKGSTGPGEIRFTPSRTIRLRLDPTVGEVKADQTGAPVSSKASTGSNPVVRST